jgi:2,4-dienoyl-CoA reductase-like NADH-dependent reductase (Old Yellow Enzyme family)
MAELFEETRLNGMTLKNRFVRSATWEGMATEDGFATRKLIDLMEELAGGEIGLIISGHAYVEPRGQASPNQLGAYDDAQIPGLTEMAKAVHQKGGKIVLQIAHAGCHALLKKTGRTPVSPSVMKDKDGNAFSREMTKEDVQNIVSAMGRAAKRAMNAGFDGVQIHAAHGYLLSQFLSPFYNHRTDEYGGSVENRARAVFETAAAVRSAVGKEIPILIKMNSEDFIEGGMTVDDMLETAALLEKSAIDAVELSGGIQYSKPKQSPVRTVRIDTPEKEVFYRRAAERFSASVNLPLILVGGIRSFSVAQQLVEEKTADYIAMSRPLIREPDLVAKWKAGDRKRSACISDNQCFRPARDGRGVFCVTANQETS